MSDPATTLAAAASRRGWTVTRQALIEHCRRLIASYKSPDLSS